MRWFVFSLFSFDGLTIPPLYGSVKPIFQLFLTFFVFICHYNRISLNCLNITDSFQNISAVLVIILRITVRFHFKETPFLRCLLPDRTFLPKSLSGYHLPSIIHSKYLTNNSRYKHILNASGPLLPDGRPD